MLNFLGNSIISWLPMLIVIGLGGYVFYIAVKFLERKAPKVGLGLGITGFCLICYELASLTVGAFNTNLCPGENCWTIAYFYIFGLLALSAAAHLVTACRRSRGGARK